MQTAGPINGVFGLDLSRNTSVTYVYVLQGSNSKTTCLHVYEGIEICLVRDVFDFIRALYGSLS